MAEVLETQEQFPVQVGIQNVDESIDFKSWTPAPGLKPAGASFAGVTNPFSASC
jgi:hypothetical protein